MDELDPFKVLGLPDGATPADASDAYRRRVALAEEARRLAPSAEDRARIERQQLLLARAYEMIDAELEDGPSRMLIGPADRPPALLASIALGAVGLAILVVALAAGSSAVYVLAIFCGAASLASALIWRHQLVESWAARGLPRSRTS
ncbi:MAG TPA: hypothetical protein VF954_05810 [Acidimicrobiales bacterium]